MTTVLSELEPGTRHETAIIDPAARIADSASVGPFAIIGPGVEIGEDVRIGPRVLVERDTRLGDGCRIHAGAVLGTDPQDLKYAGESTRLEIGERTTIREYATLNRGTAASGITRVGDDCLIMAYAHVAHDCRIGSHVILANAVNMGGHVEIEEWAIVGGLTAIHQFVRIGAHAFVGGGSRLPQDVAPFVTVAGSPCECYGLNSVGLKRRSFSAEALSELRSAYRQLFQSKMNLGQALDALEAEEMGEEVARMVSFIRASRRGITT